MASTVGLICLEIFGYTRPESRDYAVNLGIALQLTNIIRDVRVDLERGRVYLPQDDLRRFGVTEADLRAGRVTEGVRELLAHECGRAREYYRRAQQLLPREDAGRSLPPRSCAASTRASSTGSSGRTTTCSARSSACHAPGGPRSPPRSGRDRSQAFVPAPDVIVVGGGFAGLSAAVDLAGRGARVLVLEARPGLGGRATAFTDPETGEVVDNGQHALFGCYHETFRFLRTIGTDHLVQLDDQLEIEVIDRGGRHSRLRSMRLPPPLHLLGGLLRWTALSWRDRAAAAGDRPGARARGAPAQPRRADGSARSSTKPCARGCGGTGRRRGSASCCGSRWRSPR